MKDKLKPSVDNEEYIEDDNVDEYVDIKSIVITDGFSG